MDILCLSVSVLQTVLGGSGVTATKPHHSARVPSSYLLSTLKYNSFFLESIPRPSYKYYLALQPMNNKVISKSVLDFCRVQEKKKGENNQHIIDNILIKTVRMKKGSSPEKKQVLFQKVEFPHLLLPSNIFSHLDKQHSIPQYNQIKTAIIRILSLRHEWTVPQFIKEIHTRSLLSNFSMKVVLLYAVALVVKPLIAFQQSYYDNIVDNASYFICLVKNSQFKAASVELRIPQKDSNLLRSILIFLTTFLKEIGIEVIKNGEGLRANEGMVRYGSAKFGQITMPSQITFEFTSKYANLELCYRYNLRGHPKLGGNPLKLDDFMRLGRYIKHGPLAGFQLQQIKLFNSLQQFMKKALQYKDSYLVLSIDNIFINFNSDSIELKVNLEPLKHQKELPINFFQCSSADRSIFIKEYDQSKKQADYYSASIIFLEAIAIKYRIQWFKADLQKNICILERRIVLEKFIEHIQNEKYFTNLEAIDKLRQWLHLDGSFLQHHPYFNYCGQLEEAIASLTGYNSNYITPQLKSIISPPAKLQKLIINSQFLIDLGFSELNATLMFATNCSTCLDGRLYQTYCKHQICLNCYYIDLQQKFLGEDMNPISITCPHQDCKEIISANIIFQLLNTEPDKKELMNALIKSLLSDGSHTLNSFCFCLKDIGPQENQEPCFFQKKNRQLFICQCDESRCTSCLLLFHLPLTCTEFKKQQQHILQEVKRHLKSLKISDITSKLLKMCKVFKLNKLEQQFAQIQHLVGEWLRICQCFAYKSPTNKLRLFFQDLAKQTSIKIQRLWIEQKQIVKGEKMEMIGHLRTLISLRHSFLLSIFL